MPSVVVVEPSLLLTSLVAAGAERGVLIGLTAAPHVAGMAIGDELLAVVGDDTCRAIAEVDAALRPRWVCWSVATAQALVTAGVRVATCWDVAVAHRLLYGGWRADAGRVWALLHGLDHRRLPVMGQLDLLGGGDGAGDDDEPVRPDGHLRPEWLAGAWADTPLRAARWAATALRTAGMQRERMAALEVAGDIEATTRSESTTELLCAELAADGLPIDRLAAEQLIASMIGPRAVTEAEASALRAERDQDVLRHLPAGGAVDLRSPADVKAMLRRLGVDVPDTRAWRLEQLRDMHPAIEALLQWRKAERISTTFGYGWLDTHVRVDGRLRGEWAGSDGAAGRMTAGAGLHNLPAELRPVVVAEPGHLFVRADLGQIEPRVLAAVSGDAALAKATQDDDLYAPVAKRLGVERAVAKVAVLAAMYGQTSGTAGQALRGMETGYPVAMKYLSDAAQAGFESRELRTYGGRLIRMYDNPETGDQRAVAAGRGRYARNAMVQGAAAELFKVWAVTVRARGAAIGARIVLCLHDELLLHVPEGNAETAASLLHDCLGEAAYRWQPRRPGAAPVRFVADVSIVRSWADAKG
ncbi:MAG: DNA polymerase [Ilumatobacteraceae bacterium]